MAQQYGVGFALQMKGNEAKNSIKSVRKELKALRGDVTSLVGGLSTPLKISGILSLTSALKGSVNAMIKASSKQAEYVENLNLLDTAYGTTSNTGRQLINTMSDLIGLDPSNLTKSLGVYRQMTSALGIAGETANTLSENLVQMQTDMMSLYNLSFERAGQILQVTLSGNTKSIRALGGDITETSLQQTAWNMGIEKSIDNMNRAEKTMLIYYTLQRQLANSNGDMAKTINTVSNQTKTWTEQWNMLGRQVGGFVIPVLSKVLPVVNGILMAFNKVISGFATLLGIDAQSLANDFGTSLSDYTTGVDDLGSGLDNASKKANKLKNSLRDFDQLHNITTPDTTTTSGGSSSGVGSGLGAIDSSILDALTKYNLHLDEMNNKALYFRDKILDWLSVFEILEKPMKELADLTYDGLNYLWKNVLVPLGKWTAWELIPSVLKVISSSLELIYKVAKTLQPYVKFGYEKIIQPLAGILGKSVINTLDDVSDLLDSISNNKVAVNLLALVTAIYGVQKASKLLMATKIGNYISTFTSLVKTAYKETGTLGGTIKEVADVTLATSKVKNFGDVLNKLTSAGKSALVALTGFEVVKTSFESISTNGVNVVNILTTLVGTLVTVGATIKTVTTIVALFNTTLAVNPIVLLVSAIAGLGVAIAGMVSGYKSATKSVEENTSALQKNMEQAKETADKTSVLYTHAKDLTSELERYVDSNGRVKKSDESRVQYILSNLSKALDEEITMTNGVIKVNGKVMNSYDDIKKSLTNLIAEKKKEAYLSAYEESYISALKERKTAYDNMVKAYSEGNEEAIKSAKESYDSATKFVKSYEDLTASTSSTMKTALVEFEQNVGIMTEQELKEAQWYYNYIKQQIESGEIKARVTADTSQFMKATDNINSTFKKDFTISVLPNQSKLTNAITKTLNGKSWTINFTGTQDKGNYTQNFTFKAKADGGFLDRGDIFVANEKGPEMVGKMGNKTTVANQEQITEGIRRATRQGFMEALSTTSNNKNINVVIEAKGDTQGFMNFINFKQKETDRQFGF